VHADAQGAVHTPQLPRVPPVVVGHAVPRPELHRVSEQLNYCFGFSNIQKVLNDRIFARNKEHNTQSETSSFLGVAGSFELRPFVALMAWRASEL
jgi:hypothetical protein